VRHGANSGVGLAHFMCILTYGVGSLTTAAAYALHWGFLAWCLSLTITVIVIVRSLRAQTPRPRAA